MQTTDLLSKPGMSGTDYRKARDGWIAAVLAHKGATGKRFNATAVRIAVALHQLSWTETTDNHRRGTFTGGAVMLAEHAGFAGIAERAQRNNAYSGTSALRDAGFLVLVSQGLGGAAVERSKAHNAVWALSLPSTRTPECGVRVGVNPAPDDLNVTTHTPEYGVTHTPEYGDLPPGSPLASPLANNTKPQTRFEGAQNHTTEEHTDFDHFTAVVEKQKRWDFSQHCDRYGEDYDSMLDEFSSAKGCDTSKNWVAAFKGFVRDWSQTHGQSSPSRPSQGTAPVRNRTPAAPSSPAPVIDAEIVQDPTDEETPINPLSFRALFTADPRPGMARCLSALSTLQKAGITDEEIHRAHKAGRMDEHPNPDDCAERIIRDRDTTTADCPF